MPSVLTSLIVALWAIAIAILSVQNATLVSLKFFGFQSIQMPVGIVLASCVGVGLIGGAIAQLLRGSSDQKDKLPRSTSPNR